MIRYLAALCVCLCGARAQSGIGTPRAGCLLGADGSLRPVYGIAGAFLAGEPVTNSAVSAACSEDRALVKTEGTLELRDGTLRLLASWKVPAGPVLFAFAGNTNVVFVYFAGSHDMMRVMGPGLPRAVPGSQWLGDNVLAITSPDLLHLLAVVREETGLWLVRMSLPDGTIYSRTPLDGVAAPVALERDGTVVYGDGSELVVRQTDGAERRIALPAPALAIEQMGDVWLTVRLRGGGAPAAVRTKPGREGVYRVPLPEATQ
jgi:hypothetical protein